MPWRWPNSATARGSCRRARRRLRGRTHRVRQEIPGQIHAASRRPGSGARQGAGGAVGEAGQGTADDALLHDAGARQADRDSRQGEPPGPWVKAASDWGRVVYCLNDAKGERWVRVGKKGEWNVDDIAQLERVQLRRLALPDVRAAGQFALRPLPRARHHVLGLTTQGDMVVDLPLTLEKIIVERRTHVIHGTEQLPRRPTTWCWAACTPNTKSPRTRRTRRSGYRAWSCRCRPARRTWPTRSASWPSRGQRRPGDHQDQPAGARIRRPALSRPLRARRAGAKTYEVGSAPIADGRGAVLLGKDWTTAGQLLTGLSPNIDLYLFVVAKTKTAKHRSRRRRSRST